MSQRELEQELCRITGESLDTIRRRGFSIAVPSPSIYEPEPDEVAGAQIVDWDHVDSQRRMAA